MTMPPLEREDGRTLEGRFKASEDKLSAERVKLVLGRDGLFNGMTKRDRRDISEMLWNIVNVGDGLVPNPRQNPDYVLEAFCQAIFEASFAEVLQAWDEFCG